MKPRVLEASIQNVDFGARVQIVLPSNIYDANLRDDVFIGPFCEIQRGVLVGKRTRIQSHTFICELVSIGEDCFIGHGVMFINDRFGSEYSRGDKTKWEATSLADRIRVGSNATILPVSICSDVLIGAGSVVTKDIHESGTYAGNPARRIR